MDSCRTPKPGEVVAVGVGGSVQFGGDRGFNFRVIGVRAWSTTADGWLWLDGYQLNGCGVAVARRLIFVFVPGLEWVADPQLVFSGSARGR